jgi:Ser/Thr protein kinase RdoA (MazF antagonist)
MSGSEFARVRTSRGLWALRMWPAGSKEERLRFVHRSLLHIRSRGFSGVPIPAATDTGDTVLRLHDRLFDAQEWMPGEPLSGRPTWGMSMPNLVLTLEGDMLTLLAAAVARFHNAGADLEPEEGESVALATHLAGAAEGVGECRDLLAGAVRRLDGCEERRVALVWLDLLPEAVVLAEDCLRRHPVGAERLSTLCHGDLWGEHVLSDGPASFSFVDFEGLHFGSPAFDLAQLILHFNGWGVREAILQAYDGVSDLEAGDRAVLPAAAVVDLAWEGCWSLSLLYGGNGKVSPREKAAHELNLRALLGSLKAVIADLS